MYAGIVVLLCSILLVLWFYFLVTIKNATTLTTSNTSIELNIINSKKTVTTVQNGTALQRKKTKYHVPKFMLELYENNRNGGRNFTTSGPDVVRSLIPKHAGSLYDNEIVEQFSDNHLLIFDLPSADDDEKFVAAELKILTIVDVDTNSILGVQRKLTVSIYDDTTKTLLHLQEMKIRHMNNTWLTFNVTEAVVKILDKNHTNKYLKIVITITAFLPPNNNNHSNQFKLSLMPVSEDFQQHDYPILILSYTSKNSGGATSKASKRKKRSIEEDYEEETNNVWDDEPKTKVQQRKLKRIRNNCRRKPLYVDFSEIQYDIWIVQPSGYEAYQCQGRCFYPVAEHLNPTKHAIVQALVHSVAPSRASRSCCVPTALDSISILYVDSHGVLTYRLAYKDMVVVACGCR